MPSRIGSLIAATATCATTAFATAAFAQQPPARVSVTGIVYDSVARAPLVGAEIQLIRVDTAGAPEPRGVFARSDSTGSFRASDVPAGTWLAGFFHPAIDSLGIEPPLRRVTIAPGREARVELWIPGPVAIARGVCGAAARDSTTFVTGFVRDAATGAPRADATVRVTWSDLVIDRSGLRRELQQAESRTLANGWYGACGVPSTATIGIRAAIGADTTGVQDVELSARRLVRRDLWLGGGANATAPLRGTVRTSAGRGLAGARVVVLGGTDSATTTDDGTFTLGRAPIGSQTLDVRAVGYIPVRRSVDVLGGAASNRADVTLVGLRAYLDTVRVRARSLYSADHNGFERRRRSAGSGYFLDREAIERRGAIHTMDIFNSVPGARVERVMGGEVLSVRSDFGGMCRPDIYVDGMAISYAGTDLGPDMLELVNPDEIEGIEVYHSQAFVPPEYTRGMSGCGSVLIWTHPPLPKPPRPPKPPKTKKP